MGSQVVAIEECVGEVDIFTSATGNFKISGFEQRRHVAPTGPNVGAQSLQGDPARPLVNLLNFVENAITFKYEHFALNDIVIDTNDIGQNNILDVDMYDDCLMRGSSKVVLTLKDEGFKQCLRGGTACRKTKKKRNRIKAMRKIAYAQTSPSSDESSTNISVLEPSWIKEEESEKEDEKETHEAKAEEEVVTLICSKYKGGFDEENFCCEMFNRNCFSDASCLIRVRL